MNRIKNSKTLKTVVNIILIFIIIVANILLLFYPQYSKSENSFIELKEKKEVIETNDMEIQKNYIEIETKQRDLATRVVEGGEAEIKEKLLKQNINLDELKLHIPSILIEFEQNARKNDVDMIIRYDLMKNSSEINRIPNEQEIEIETEIKPENEREKTKLEKRRDEVENIRDEIEDDTNGIENENDIEGEGKGGVETKETETSPNKPSNIKPAPTGNLNNTNDKTPSDDSILTAKSYFNTEQNLEAVLTTDDLPNINGIQITIIPLEVTGSYEGVRDYLQYLDKLDYIEPAFVEINSVGEEMHGVIVLYILHTIE